MSRRFARGNLAGLVAATVVFALGLTACGEGDDGTLMPVGAAPVITVPGYSSGRPAPAASAVGTSVAALSSAIGISGAARLSGSIPAPAIASGAARSALAGSAAGKRALKLVQAGKAPRIADTPENRDAVQGYWWDGAAGEHVAIIGEDIYAVSLAGGCSAAVDGTVTEELPNVVSVTPTTLTHDDGSGNVTFERDTTGQVQACVTSETSSTTAGAAITSLVGQVSLSDNSTFGYLFSTTQQPTAVFVQFEGASEYFVVPFSALTAGADDSYTITFFGPTPGTVRRVIDLLLEGRVIVQAFYGEATQAELLGRDFPGVSNIGNWSAPAFVDFVAQPAGSGELQFSLTWNTQNDVDLHVVEPGGNEIYYANPVSVTGGELDVDNIYGYGPENIYWMATVPSGTYTVFVENFDGTFAAGYTLTVIRLGVPTTYTGTLPAVAGARSTSYTVTMP